MDNLHPQIYIIAFVQLILFHIDEKYTNVVDDDIYEYLDYVKKTIINRNRIGNKVRLIINSTRLICIDECTSTFDIIHYLYYFKRYLDFGFEKEKIISLQNISFLLKKIELCDERLLATLKEPSKKEDIYYHILESVIHSILFYKDSNEIMVAQHANTIIKNYIDPIIQIQKSIIYD
jgi:hypothetical protein